MRNAALFYAITPSMFLATEPVPVSSAVTVTAQPVHHFLVLDCSGSMAGHLGEVGDQLKNEIPSLVGPNDTISIFWFSGSGQSGPVIEGATVSSPVEIDKLRRAIDATLRPVGLTCFDEPLALVAQSIAKVTAKRPGLVSLFFMSDGQHNQGGSRADVLRAVEGLAASCNAFTAVEVGWYADRALLSAMAQKAGGQVVACADLSSYRATLAKHVKGRPAAEPRVHVGLSACPMGDTAFALTPTGDLLTFDASTGTVEVSPTVGTLFYLTEQRPAGKAHDLGGLARATVTNEVPASFAIVGAYAALAVFAHAMNSDVVYALLRALGDVALVRQFSSCYGAQPYLAFEDAAKVAAFDPSQRWTDGYDAAAVPNDDALTALQVLRILVDGNAGLLTSHPAFAYTKVSRARDEATALTAEHRKAIEDTLAAAKGVLDLDTVRATIAEIQASAPASLTFTANEAPAGYPMSGLVLASKRANASLQVMIPGTVDLSAVMTGELSAFGVPTVLPTKIVRTYTVIKDGIIHTTKLPVMVDVATWTALRDAGVPGIEHGVGYQPVVVLDLAGLPTINRRMVGKVSAERLFSREWERIQANADAAVCEHFLAAWFGGDGAKTKGLAALYGATAATVLGGYGVKDYGFSPPGQTSKPSTDYYEAKRMELGFAGFKSMPKVTDVLARLDNETKGETGKGKGLTPAMELYRPMIAQVEAEAKRQGLPGLACDRGATAVMKAWLVGQRDIADARSRAASFALAELSYAILVGQAWPFKTRAESTYEIDVGGKVGVVKGTLETGIEKVLL